MWLRGKTRRKIAQSDTAYVKKLFAVNNVWFWRCFRVLFPCLKSNFKTLLKRNKNGRIIFLQSWLIKGSVGHSTIANSALNSLCAGTHRETIEDYLYHFWGSCFNKSQVQPWQWQMAKQLAASSSSSSSPPPPSSSCTFFCNQGPLRIEGLDNHSFGKTYCVLYIMSRWYVCCQRVLSLTTVACQNNIL